MPARALKRENGGFVRNIPLLLYSSTAPISEAEEREWRGRKYPRSLHSVKRIGYCVGCRQRRWDSTVADAATSGSRGCWDEPLCFATKTNINSRRTASWGMWLHSNAPQYGPSLKVMESSEQTELVRSFDHDLPT